jgi:endosialidase-like protein
MPYAGGGIGLAMGVALGMLIGLLGTPVDVGAAGGESAFVGLTPCRLVDTRGNGFAGGFGPPALVAGTPRDFPLQAQCGIPATATAVSLNVTATNTLGPGFFLLHPQGAAPPLVSTLNYVAGETVANAALVPLGPGGLTVVAGVSGADLVLDVDGYFTDALVHGVDPENLFVGAGAGNLATTGANNTVVGSGAFPGNATGSSNTAIGRGALSAHVTGDGNVALGAEAGSLLTTGNGNVYIANRGVAAESGTLRIGSGQTSAFIAGVAGVGLVGPTANVVIDSSGQLGSAGGMISSRRAKTDIEPIAERSRELHALRPVTFRYRAQLPGGKREYGLIAEEVAEVYPELVVRDAEGAPAMVRYDVLPALLLNELQRLERAGAEKDRRLDELAAKLAELTARVHRLEGGGSASAEHRIEEP